MIQMHERDVVVRSAKIDLQRRIADWSGSHELTDLEELSILSDAFGSLMGAYLKYMIRSERLDSEDKSDGPA